MTLIAKELTKILSRELISPQIAIRTDQQPNDKIDQFDKSKDQINRVDVTPQNVSFHQQKVQFDGPEVSLDLSNIQRTKPSETIINPFWFVNFTITILQLQFYNYNFTISILQLQFYNYKKKVVVGKHHSS
jgi:hypothetical protein